MKFMTELAGGELCLPHRPHNQVGAARRGRRMMITMMLLMMIITGAFFVTKVLVKLYTLRPTPGLVWSSPTRVKVASLEQPIVFLELDTLRRCNQVMSSYFE